VEAEFSIRLVVTEAGQTVADAIIDEPQALLGSAAHCDVRLGPDKVAPEQLAFEAKSGHIYAQLRAIRPPVLLNRSPFHSGKLRDDSVLSIGTLEVRATLEQRYHSSKQSSEKKVQPIHVALVALTVVVLVGAILKLNKKAAIAEAPKAPALFTEQVAPCPETGGEGALSAGYELLAQADSKRERAPFLPEEGLDAVPLYRTAAACLELGKDLITAKQARTTADALQAFVERDYHLHQVRVYRASESADFDLLAAETKVLSGYMKNSPGPYAAWLDQLGRDLEAEHSADKKKKGK
jgi:hypothetical protein